MGEPVPSIAKLLVELDMPDCEMTLESMQFALSKAVTLGNHEGVRYLIELYGLDIDRPYNHKKTLLHMALSAGNESMVRLLLEYGARINIPDAAGVKATDLAREKGLLYLLGEPRAKGDVYSSTINTFQDHLRGRGLGLAEATVYEAVLGID